MSKKFSKAAVCFAIMALLIVPTVSFAGPCEDAGGTTVSGVCLPKAPSGAVSDIDTLSQLIIRILNIALGVVGIISVLFVVIGGFQYVTAAGDEEKIKSAKGMILNALIGLVIVLMAFAIIRVVASAIGSGQGGL